MTGRPYQRELWTLTPNPGMRIVVAIGASVAPSSVEADRGGGHGSCFSNHGKRVVRNGTHPQQGPDLGAMPGCRGLDHDRCG